MRYVKYKPTGIPWLPEVPEGWECCRTKQILLENDGGVWGTDPVGEDDTIVLRSTEQDVDGNLKVITPARRHLSKQEITKALLREGDLIITKSSGSEEHIGKTSLIDRTTAELSCCYSNFLQRLRVKGEPKFYWYLYNSSIAKSQFDFLCTTTTGLKNLNSRIIGNVAFALPPLPTQRAIVAFLDEKCGKIDRLVAAKEKEVALLKELKQSMIAEAVTRGVRETHAEGAERDPSPRSLRSPRENNRRLVPSGIPWLPEVPEGWEVLRIKWILNEIKNLSTTGEELPLSLTASNGLIPFSEKANRTMESASYVGAKIVEQGQIVFI